MKVAFLGSDDFALPTLDALADCPRHALVGVVSQPDRPAGRGRHLTPTPVADWATAHGLPLIKPDSINAPGALTTLAGWGADIGVVIAYGQKLGEAVMAGFPHRCVNLHSSLLPRYRGAAPISWAVINGETETGLTVFRLVEKMDAGPIVYQSRTPLDPTETAGELRQRLAGMGPDAILATLDAVADGSARFVEQDHSLASPAPKLHKSDGAIDWRQPAAVVASRIRGLYPWPGARAELVTHRGRAEEVVLVRAVASAGEGGPAVEPGTVAEDLTVAAALGRVKLLEVKPAGRKEMSFADFARGRHLAPGDRFCPIS
ncbi:MAG: Methionyl-tRNA formyltransferase [Phycisphaerae bacterium]|nr:Methionyl-tRNA formyltransferase [Phycisphaerae bacterium]